MKKRITGSFDCPHCDHLITVVIQKGEDTLIPKNTEVKSEKT